MHLPNAIWTAQNGFCSREIALEKPPPPSNFYVMSGLDSIAKLLDTSELPELGPGPRQGILPEAALNRKLDEALRQTKLPAGNEQLIRALVLLWHDHLDAAHSIAQSVENAEGSVVHGIMHRREPDYGNAKYWFRRVGKHPALRELASRVTPLLDTKSNPALREELLPRGEWDPFAFIDACERAASQPASDPLQRFLRKIQRAET
ncbi:MAG: hypothetical protein DME25_18495, partial [Verrucomicrobia bacterium]